MSLSRNFVYNLQTFPGFCQVHFTILLQIQQENNFSTSQWTPTSQSSSLSWYFFVQLLHLSLKFRLPKMSRNETPSWLRSENSEQPRIFRVTGANQNAPNLLFTDLVNTKYPKFADNWNKWSYFPHKSIISNN